MSYQRTFLSTLSFCLTLTFGQAHAADEQAIFDVTLAGFKAGTLSYAVNLGTTTYAAAGAVRASGIAAVVVEASIDTRARGEVSGNTYRPRSYSEETLEDGERKSTAYTYRNSVPSVTRTPPRNKPARYPVTTADTRGALDPMTTALAMLRDRPRDLACDLNINLFDGRRVANIRMLNPEVRGGNGLVCTGEYRRVAGFSPKELAEKPVWDFTVYYESAGDVLQVSEVRVPTTFGRVRIRRR